MSRETKKWWDYASVNYQKETKMPVDIHYGPGSPNEKHLKLLANLKDIKAIAFDFWGVFAEIKPPMYDYLKENNISTDNHSEEIHKLIIEHDLNKITEKQFLQECSKILGIIIPYPKYKYAYKKNSLNKDLIEIIQKLKDKYKIALLTNNNKEYCQEYLFKPKLDKLFDIMVISYLVGYRKPDSNIYKILIKKLNLKPEEILFVDDDPTKMASAEALGIKRLVYKGKETNKILSNLS